MCNSVSTCLSFITVFTIVLGESRLSLQSPLVPHEKLKPGNLIGLLQVTVVSYRVIRDLTQFEWLCNMCDFASCTRLHITLVVSQVGMDKSFTLNPGV